MMRTQLSFERALLRRAKARAGELGISLAEYVRRLVAEDLGGETAREDPSVVFNLGDSGGSDIAAHKGVMVADALDRERR